MKRKEFLQTSFAVSGGLILAPNILAQSHYSNAKKASKLTILHTNDTHSNIDPFPANHAKYPGKGGAERRYEIIEAIRQQEENVILLDAGDIFQGTPYFNKYKGVLEMKLMSKMGYDVATMGNHDFDIGLDGFLAAKKHANFPFVCSNYDFSDTIMNGKTESHVIIEKGALKIGVFGIGVELKGLVPGSKYGATRYLDPVTIANQKALELKKMKCDLVICLSHLGFEYSSDKVSDVKLAQQTENIHVIIGGHTHTFLEEPARITNAKGHTVLINQVGWAGVNLGRMDFMFDKQLFKNNDVIVVE